MNRKINAIRATSLKMIYPSNAVALNDCSLVVRQGDCFALLGQNGAGKTTFIHILIGLLKKTSGQIQMLGYDHARQMNQIKPLIACVPQDFNFNIFVNLETLLIQYAGYFGIPKSEAVKRCKHHLNTLQLTHLAHKPMRELSGGYKRRAMLARALMTQPKLLFLDEPTAGVDLETKQMTWDYLKKINEQGTTIVLTTHNFEEASTLCNQIGIIHEGQIKLSTSMNNLPQSMLKENIYHLDSIKLLPETLPSMPFDCSKIDSTRLSITIKKTDDFSHVCALLEKANIRIKAVHPKHNKLEQCFLSVTQATGNIKS
jgi:ABC-2 type transport system ATP-binding protein